MLPRVVMISLGPLYFFFFTGIGIGVFVGLMVGLSSKIAQLVLGIGVDEVVISEKRRGLAEKSIEAENIKTEKNKTKKKTADFTLDKQNQQKQENAAGIDVPSFQQWYDREVSGQPEIVFENRYSYAPPPPPRQHSVLLSNRQPLDDRYDSVFGAVYAGIPAQPTILEEEDEEVVASGSDKWKGEYDDRWGYGKRQKGVLRDVNVLKVKQRMSARA